MEMNQDTSRHIPSDIKSEVRKRCFFGCILCGSPIYDYDHIDEFSKTKSHTAENITLLCPEHHALKTRNRLPLSKIIEANSSPVNSNRSATSASMLYFHGQTATIKLGDSTFQSTKENPFNEFIALEMNSLPIISFDREGNDLLLNLIVRDVMLNDVIRVDKGELVMSTNVTDITYVSRRLTVNPKYMPSLIMSQHDDTLEVEQARIFGRGVYADIDKNSITLMPSRAKMSNIHARNCRVGISLS
jgi:trigger factor